ncbi:MAG: hypothetical protein DMG39_17130 [Acidobacteria bacterium]|nr:MAG: hypothetical protein DMG39_17130 [Acidobacteriota bacterium]
MNFRSVATVYRKELTEWLRDRRTLISTVLVPLLAFPVLMVGMTSLMAVMMNKAEKEIPKVMIIQGENSPRLVAALQASKDLEIVPYADDWKDQISNKQIRAGVEIPPGFDASLSSKSPLTVQIHYYQGEVKSEFAARHVEDSLKSFRDDFVKERLEANNLPDSLISPFKTEKHNVAPAEKVSGAALGGLLGYMVILLSMTGAIYPAIDLTAGEKERGTMETILSSPLSRVDLVLGKFFLVLSASLSTAILSIISMGTSFYLVGHSPAMAQKDAAVFQLHVGLPTVLSVFLMALPLAVLFASALLTIALFAKSYKEAQSYLTPMTFDLNPKLALIPILSTSLVCKEIVAGTFHWNYILLILLSSSVYAAAGLFLAVKMFQRESVLFRS